MKIKITKDKKQNKTKLNQQSKTNRKNWILKLKETFIAGCLLEEFF